MLDTRHRAPVPLSAGHADPIASAADDGVMHRDAAGFRFPVSGDIIPILTVGGSHGRVLEWRGWQESWFRGFRIM